jgi:ketosteroid isomerase-like protein
VTNIKLHNSVPAELNRPQACFAFVHTLNSGNLNRATACFARDSCLITPDATAVYGRDRIRPVLAQLIARRTEIAVESSTMLIAGDVALAHERWEVRSNGVEGSRLEQTFGAMLTLRYIEERWKLAIVAPWGWVRG